MCLHERRSGWVCPHLVLKQVHFGAFIPAEEGQLRLLVSDPFFPLLFPFPPAGIAEGWEGQERQPANSVPVSWGCVLVHWREEAPESWSSAGSRAGLTGDTPADTEALKSHCSHWRTRSVAWPWGRWQSLVCVTRRLTMFLEFSLSLQLKLDVMEVSGDGCWCEPQVPTGPVVCGWVAHPWVPERLRPG